jgi:3-oxoacyl-[acyl-carrier-protein] synthase-3
LVDISTEAAQAALTGANLTINDIDMVICATASAETAMPSLACCVLEKLTTAENKPKIPAFDVNAACSGFIYALDVADAFITSKKVSTILLISSEKMSRLLDWNDRTTSILFGDGAAACVITAGDSLKYIKTTADANSALLNAAAFDGNNPFMGKDEENPADSKKPFLTMQGQQVFKFAVKAIEAEINSALQAVNLQPVDVDYFILHQANTRIIDSARIRLKLPAEKFPTNIQNYGNMSAASIPVLLDDMVQDGRIKRGDTLAFVGFGAGMTAGCAILTW